MAERPGWPAGTAEAIRILDDLDVDPSMSSRQAGQIVRLAGQRITNEVLRAAVRARQDGLKIQPPTVLESPQRVPKTSSQVSGAALVKKRAGTAPAHPSPKVPKDLQGGRAGTHSARSGTPSRYESGAPPLPSSGAAGAPRPEPVDNSDDNFVVSEEGNPFR
jgi:hypothetical protein